MTAIAEAFARIRERGTPGLVTYVTAGDPDVERFVEIVRAIDAAGADVIEVGVPFSDPLADGPVIQRAAERALAQGVTLPVVLSLLERLHGSVRAPLVLFTYANPVLRLGLEAFADAARRAGVGGVLVLDLPYEEAGDLRALLRARGIDVIVLVSPTTTDARLRDVVANASGFVYAVSRLGVTGVRDRLDEGAPALVRRVRAATDLPVALGFGISTPAQVREACEHADAAVVGSALVHVIEESGRGGDVAQRAGDYVRRLLLHTPAERARISERARI